MLKVLVKNAMKLFDSPATWPDFDDETIFRPSSPKRRCLLETDGRFRTRFTSDDFLCPAGDFGSSNRMASSSLFSSVSTVHSGSSQQNRERKVNGRTEATKENIISISDDEDKVDKNEHKASVKLKSHDDSCKDEEVKEWFPPKPFAKRELYLNQNKPPPRKDESDSEVQFVKMVEQKNEKGLPCEIVPYRRVVVMERRRENPLHSRAFSTPLKSRSSPHISLTSKKTPGIRKLAMDESFRLEEKKKYSELLQKFTDVPISSDSSCTPIRIIGERRKIGISGTSQNTPSGPVEFIDLTKGKDMGSSGSGSSDIQVLDDKGSLVTKMGEDKSEQIRDVIKKTKEHPLYDRQWTNDLARLYNHKGLDRRRKEEQEKLRIQLCSQKSKELLQDFLEEQIQTHMRITEVVIPEEIITLDDDELMLPKLTVQMERMVTAAFQRGNPSEVLVECFSQRITRRDIATLSSINWLNDEVINFYMNLLIERGKEGKYPSMYGFNTFFYPKLIQSGHASLRRWTRKVDIFAHDILIVPVHRDVHWCMCAVDLRKKTIQYYDSMGAPNNNCLEAMMKYMEDEMMDKKRQKFDRTGWTLKNVQDIPQQMNGSDCGMFACMYAEFLCRDAKITFTQKDMPYFRRKMAYEILSKKLLL